MAVQRGCSCRIFTFGKVENGCADCDSWKRMSAVSGSRCAITTMATPAMSRGTTVIETAVVPVRRLEWQIAEVREIAIETPRAKSIKLRVPSWRGHLPGQHLEIRLTADDGYQAQRS